MPWNLLLLPLAAGYYLLTRLKYLKFIQQRLDQQRLIFDTILWGIFVLAFTTLIRYSFEFLFPELVHHLYQYFPVKNLYAGTTLCSFALTVIITEILNATIFRNPEKQIERAIKLIGNELELLLRVSVSESKMLQFTLDSDKVYVAWVKELPIPKVTNYIRVIPVLSGYRDQDKTLIFTTHYLMFMQNISKREGQWP